MNKPLSKDPKKSSERKINPFPPVRVDFLDVCSDYSRYSDQEYEPDTKFE